MRDASPQALLRAQFFRFAIVGSGGFLVDVSVLALLHSIFGLSASVARVLSMTTAMTFTWWGNRTLTFHDRAASGARAMFAEWLRFAAANSIGAAINYGTYVALIHAAPAPLNNPYLATVCGVGFGMLFNFTGSRMLVFQSKKPIRAAPAALPPPPFRLARQFLRRWFP